MKKLSYIIFILGVFGLFSCDEEPIGPIISIGDAPSLSVTNTSFVLTEDNADQLIDMFSWTKADYGFKAATTYTLEFDKAGNEFANAFKVASSTDLEFKVETATINNLLLAKEVKPDIANDMEARIVASVSDSVQELISSSVAFSVTPFFVLVEYPKIYVPGAHQGWSPKDAPMLYSLKSNDKYEGFVWFPEAGNKFKFTPAPNWDSDWGKGDADGTLKVKGSDIEAGDAGMYKLNVNLNDLTFEMVLTNWGVIGDATPGGWDNDTDLTFDADNYVLTATMDLTAGKIKFRANDGWDINLGDNEPDGRLEYGGSDIEITDAGNYTVVLNLSEANYTYTLTKN